MSALSGTCLCGEIKVTLKGEPVKVMTCHCSQCQKSSGAPYQSNAIYPTSQVDVADPKNYLKMYLVPKETVNSGFEKQKYFCGNCGCPLFNRPMKYNGEKSVVKLGILDAPADYQGSGVDQLKPVTELFTKNRVSYVPAIEGCKQFETAAP